GHGAAGGLAAAAVGEAAHALGRQACGGGRDVTCVVQTDKMGSSAVLGASNNSRTRMPVLPPIATPNGRNLDKADVRLRSCGGVGLIIDSALGS
uniref:Uncharacterized protein n=2 Tax=Aegilops tauschii subsp. strangulata TaxID=200361 RepID=A0A453LGG2_AEGTS